MIAHKKCPAVGTSTGSNRNSCSLPRGSDIGNRRLMVRDCDESAMAAIGVQAAWIAERCRRGIISSAVAADDLMASTRPTRGQHRDGGGHDGR